MISPFCVALGGWVERGEDASLKYCSDFLFSIVTFDNLIVPL